MDDDYRPTLGFGGSSDEAGSDSDQNPHISKRRATRTTEDQMLGIWAYSDDDKHDGTRGGGGGGYAAKPIPNTQRPTVFVAASDNSAVAEPKPAEPPNGSDEPKSLDRSNAQDTPLTNNLSESASSSATDSSSESDGSDSSSEEHADISESNPKTRRRYSNRSHGIDDRSRKPAAQQNVSKEFGKFTNSTVWNMMAKMGYKAGEGLGKHGEGRVEPVQVVLRREGEGISYSRNERPPYSYHAAELVKSKGSQGMTAGFGNLADIATPSKSRSKSPIASQSSKIEYRTLEELQQRTDARMKEVFVDMSTNVQVSSLAELVSKKLPLNEKEQLARDARLGLDLAFSRLEHIKRETSIEETRCSVLHKDIDRLSSSIDQRRKIVECFSKIRRAIKAVYDKAGDTTITSIESAMDDMADLFSSFHDLYDMAQKIEASKNGFDVWHELHLEQVVTSVMFDCLKRVLVIWKPAEHMQILAVVLAPLRMFISTNDGNIQAETMTPFESLLNRVLVPCLKRFIFTEWDPLSDNLGGILDILPQTTVFSISPDIGSVLQRFVDEINTRVVMNGYNRSLAENGGSDSAQMSLAPLRMDRIVIPWLPFILERGELLSSIRRKLCAVLSLWTPSTKSNKDVVALMAPWLQVLQGKDLYKLGSKVAGRLEYMLESEFQFNAQKQVIWPFKALLEWHDVLPFDVWFSIAKRGVISKFLDYLWAWLQHPNSNYAEIANWYWQWRHMYPDDIFVHPDVQSEFRTALVYMAHSMVQK